MFRRQEIEYFIVILERLTSDLKNFFLTKNERRVSS